MSGHLEGEQPYSGDLVNLVTNQLLTWFSKYIEAKTCIRLSWGEIFPLKVRKGLRLICYIFSLILIWIFSAFLSFQVCQLHVWYECCQFRDRNRNRVWTYNTLQNITGGLKTVDTPKNDAHEPPLSLKVLFFIFFKHHFFFWGIAGVHSRIQNSAHLLWVKTRAFESTFLKTNFFPTSQTPNSFFPSGGGTLPLPGAECTSCEAQQKTITINNVSHRVFLALLEHLEPTGPVVEDSGCFFYGRRLGEKVRRR